MKPISFTRASSDGISRANAQSFILSVKITPTRCLRSGGTSLRNGVERDLRREVHVEEQPLGARRQVLAAEAAHRDGDMPEARVPEDNRVHRAGIDAHDRQPAPEERKGRTARRAANLERGLSLLDGSRAHAIASSSFA